MRRISIFLIGLALFTSTLCKAQKYNFKKTAYAKLKGVDVMVWVIWNSLKNNFEAAFDQYEKWGIKGIKMDFMDRDDQQMVEFYEKVCRKAAEKR